MKSQDDYSRAARRIYDKVADWYVENFWTDVTDNDWLEDFVRRFAKPARICDVASGPGNFSRHLHPDYHHVLAFDISENMTRSAVTRVPGLMGVVGDMRYLPVATETLDGLLCAYSMNHIVRDQVPAVLNEFWRTLAPGGTLCLMLKEGHGWYEFGASGVQDVKCIMQLWTIPELVSYLDDAGFIQEKMVTKEELHQGEFAHRKICAMSSKPL